MNIRNKNRLTVGIMMAITLMSPNFASALGVDVKIESKRDTFVNEGLIRGEQKVFAGGASQHVGQRVRAHSLDGKLVYKSQGNVYKNTGRIEGSQLVMGGVASQAVGQEVY